MEVRNNKDEIISKRKFILENLRRCLCMWSCACICIGSFATVIDSVGCYGMDFADSLESGFDFDIDYDKSENRQEILNWFAIFGLMLFVFGLILLLGKLCFHLVIQFVVFPIKYKISGILKACCGCFSWRYGKWRYDYLQPQLPFEDASK